MKYYLIFKKSYNHLVFTNGLTYNFVVNNFKKLKVPSDEGTHALFMRYVKGQEIITDGERRILRDKSDELVADGFSKLIINKMRG